MKIGRLLRTLLYICLFVIFIAYFTTSSPLFDLESIIYLYLFIIMMICFLYMANPVNFPLVVLLIMYNILTFLVVIIYLLLVPEYANSIDYYWVTSSNLNRGLLYLVLGTFIAGIGILMATKNVRIKNTIRISLYKQINRIKILPLLLLLTIISVVSVQFSLKFGYGGKVFSLRWLTPFCNSLAISYLFMAIAIFNWENLTKKDKLLVYLGVTIYLLSRGITGSRHGVLGIFLIYVFVRLVDSGKYFIVKKKHLIAFLILICVGIFMFPIITDLRLKCYIYKGDTSLHGIKETIINSLLTYDIHNYELVIERISRLHALLLIVNDKTNIPPHLYVNISNTIKNIFNRLIPGTNFPTISTARLFPVIYEGGYISDILSSSRTYHSASWTFYGIFYTLFGYTGGLLAIFLSSFLLAYLWRVLLLSTSKVSFKPIIMVFYLYVFYTFLVNFGLDEWITIYTMHMGGAMFIYLYLCSILSGLNVLNIRKSV